jgi:hypothetical protein
MASQKKINKPKDSGDGEGVGQEGLKSKFEEIKKMEVHPETRMVKLHHHCDGTSFTRTVPWDSKLRNGDVVPDSDWNKTDSDYERRKGQGYYR